jgi:hypothetical protein
VLEYPGHAIPFYVKDLRITWVATNSLPQQLAILTPAPHVKPVFALSNLLAALSLSWTNEVRSDDAELTLLQNMRAFRSSDGRRLLNVFEPEGRFYYSDKDAFEFRREEADRLAVPETTEATRLSMEVLSQMGFPTILLADEREGQPRARLSEGRRGWMDRDTRKQRSVVYRRGVAYSRWFEGIRVSGNERVRLEHGPHACLGTLAVEWAPWQVESRHAVVATSRIVQWLREGRAAVADMETTGARTIEAKEIRRVRIMGVEVRYAAGEALSSAEHVFPLGILEAQVDLGPSDFEEVTLFTPLIEAGLPAPQRPADCSFMVYPPRAFRESMPAR